MDINYSNIKIVLGYDGTDFLGWQETECGLCIEGTLKKVLQQILQEDCLLQVASRTDRGVHASGQVAHFITSKSPINLNLLKKSLNALLPPTIRIHSLQKMELSFHPTLDAMGKEYHYHIFTGEILPPLLRHHYWHIYPSLDVEKMQKGAKYLCGKHDFSSFCNTRKDIESTEKNTEIYAIRIDPLTVDKIRIVITGKRFLYKMVRNIVGTLVNIGQNVMDPEVIPLILEMKNRACAGVTAPACGLILADVFYPEEL
jgi:tRNA pseudouridine38-40 synthase